MFLSWCLLTGCRFVWQICSIITRLVDFGTSDHAPDSPHALSDVIMCNYYKN